MAHKGEKYQGILDINEINTTDENEVIFGEKFSDIVQKAQCRPPALIVVNRIDENFYMKHIEDFRKQLQKSVESTGAWLLVDDKTLPFIQNVFGKKTSYERSNDTVRKKIRAHLLRKDIYVVWSTDTIVGELEVYLAKNSFVTSEQEQKIPVIKVVIGGGQDQIDLFKKTVGSGAGWVVVPGTGSAADYIANKTDNLRSQHLETLIGLSSYKGSKDNKIFVCSFGQEDDTLFEQNIQNFMFDAVKDSPEHYRIDLVSKWNRIDIFKDEIFAECLKNRRVDSKKEILLGLFESSFEKGNKEFVEVLVDFLAKEISDHYMTEKGNESDKMETLYNKCFNVDIKGNTGNIIWAIINNKTNSGRNNDEPKKITLAEIQRVIHAFCGDNKLNVYGKSETRIYVIQVEQLLKRWKLDSKESEAEQEEVMFRLFVCCILTNRKDMAMIFWKRCKNNIFAALFASNILRKMARQASKQHLLELFQSCSENASFFEGLSTRVMTEFFEYKSDAALKFLVTEVKRYNATPLEFANRCRLMKFIAATPCQVKLETLWMGDIDPRTPPFKVFFGILCPVLIMFNAGFINVQLKLNEDDAKCKQIIKATWNFFRAPISTFFVHMILYIAFLTNFSLFVLSDLYPVSVKGPSGNEVVTWVLVLSLIIEEICQVFANKGMAIKYKIKDWGNDLWNLFDMITFIVFTVAVTLRFVLGHEDFFYARFAYSISLGLFILRTLQFFYLSRHIGPKVVMLEKLMTDVLFFISLFAVFVFTFGIMYQVTLFPNSETSWELFKNIVFLPYMQLYGELNIDIVRGSEPSDCTDDIETYQNGTLPRCPHSSAYNTFMLAVYLIFTNILLLNTLIAMFSFTIQKVHQNSETIWKYNRYTVIREYYERRTFPVPLIADIWRIITPYISCISKTNAFALEANDAYDVLECKAVENYLLDPTKAERILLHNQMKEHYNMLVDKIVTTLKPQRQIVIVYSDWLPFSHLLLRSEKR